MGARRRTGGPSRGTNARSTPLRKRTGSAPLGAPAVRGRSSQRSGTARLLYRWRRQHASMGRNAAMGRGGPHRLQGARTTPEPRHARSLLSSELLELLGARRVASPPPPRGRHTPPPFSSSKPDATSSVTPGVFPNPLPDATPGITSSVVSRLRPADPSLPWSHWSPWTRAPVRTLGADL